MFPNNSNVSKIRKLEWFHVKVFAQAYLKRAGGHALPLAGVSRRIFLRQISPCAKIQLGNRSYVIFVYLEFS